MKIMTPPLLSSQKVKISNFGLFPLPLIVKFLGPFPKSVKYMVDSCPRLFKTIYSKIAV